MEATWLDNEHPALRRCWHPVARSVEVGADPVPVRLLGEDWVLVRLDGRLTAFEDRCPHRLAPLSAGFVDGDTLRCRYHGWCFDADGACVEIPANGTDGRIPARAAARPPAALREADGFVFLAPEPPLAEPLELDSDIVGDPTFTVGFLEPTRATVGAGLMADNFLDMAHFPFLHAATIGTEESAVLHDLAVERDGLGMVVRSEHPFPNHEDPGVAAGLRPLLQRRRLTYTYRAPFSVSLRIDYLDAGGTNLLAFHVQPEDASTCRLYSALYRNDLDGDEHRLAEAVAYEQKILDEDLALQERYRDRRLPLDLRVEVHSKADTPTIELRRVLRELVSAGKP